MAKMFNLTSQTINKYARMELNGVPMDNTGGKPRNLDKVAEQTLVQELQGEKRIQLSGDELRTRYSDLQKVTAIRRGKPTSQINEVKRSTLCDFENRFSIQSKNSERVTDAREAA
jgi:hypothetical protein